MRWSVVVSWAGIHRYVQGISEGLRSTRILQNKRVCVKFLFGGWGGAQTPEFLGGCHCSAQPLDNANTPYSEAGWREARSHYSTNENSTEFETVRASDSYISREKRAHREGNRRNEYTYMYIYDARNTKLSIIHGSHDR